MFRDILDNIRLIGRLSINDLRGRYSGSALGVVWAVVQPLTMIVMYTMIFAVVLKVRVGVKGSVTEFGLFLICGMIAFNTVADGIRKSASVFIEQSHLLRRLPMPPVVLPAARVLTTLMEQGIALLILFPLCYVFDRPPGALSLGFLLLVPFQAAISLGISTSIACVTVMFRDVAALTESLITIWFLSTPIFYPRDFLPPMLREIINANPMTPVVEGYRSLILYDRLPPAADILYIAIFAGFFLLAGNWIYGQTRTVIIDHV